jgi:hypothetical protein
MKYAAKKDDNQDEIVSALKQMGATVTSIHQIGNGLPDILVGFRGKNYLFEIKDGKKVPSARRLTADEKKWMKLWRGHANVVKSVNEAIEILTEDI